MAVRLTNRWKTICILSYQGSVNRDENRAAHGGVCLYQARISGKNGRRGRKVNSNGRHEEIGDAFALDDQMLAHWESFDKQK